MNHMHEQSVGVSLTAALEHLREAGQRILSNEIGLARLQTQETVARNLRVAVFMTVAGTFALLAWVAFMIGIVIALAALLPWAAAVAIVGGLNMLVAAGAGLAGMHQLTPERPRLEARNGDNSRTHIAPADTNISARGWAHTEPS